MTTRVRVRIEVQQLDVPKDSVEAYSVEWFTATCESGDEVVSLIERVQDHMCRIKAE